MLVKKEGFPIKIKELANFDYEMYSVDGLPFVNFYYARKIGNCLHFSEKDVEKCGHDYPSYKWDNGDVCIVLVKDGETCPAR